MRWFIPDDSEAAERAAVTRKIDAWWVEFQRNAGRIDDLFARRAEWDLAEWMTGQLEQLSTETLFWEFGPGLSGGHRLVITAEGDKHLRPLVAEVVRRAPSIAGWDFLTHRPPEDLEDAASTVEGRTGVEASTLTASATAGEYGLINLTFFAKRVDPETEEAAFVATEALLGEQVLETWIGTIETMAGKGRPLGELGPSVAELIEKRRASLPPKPWYASADSAKWSALELKPRPGTDWPGQEDLRIGTTPHLEFFENTRSGAPFDSRRYSTHGETFCYLKIDGSRGFSDDGGFADKAAVGDALVAALEPGKLGAYIGGGTGTRYSYLDLALVDVKAAIPVIREAMQRGKLTRRAWLLFFDDNYLQEWVGIWPDSPPPLLPPIDG